MLGHYILVAFRNFRRSPVATGINVLSLALGLACFVVAYAVVGYWDHAEQGFAKADRTYVVTLSGQRGPTSFITMPLSNPTAIRYIKSDFPDFEAVARMVPRDVDDMGVMTVSTGVDKTTVTSAYVDPEFLKIFDLPFVEGDAKTALANPDSVILTQAAAKRLFGDADPIGRHFLVDNITDATVTGVIGPIQQPSHLNGGAAAATQFEVLASYDMYQKFWDAMLGQSMGEQKDNWLGDFNDTSYILLPKGSSLTAAALNERLAAFSKRRVPANVQADFKLTFGVIPVSRLMIDRLNTMLFVGSNFGMSFTTILLVLGALVLAVACLNYANLATALAMTRSKEVGLRKTLGARRGQIIGQYLFEAGLLAGVALVLALIAVELAVPLLRQAVGIDLALVMFSGAGFWLFLVALVAGVSILAGSYPAFVLSQVRPISALRSGTLSGGRRIMPKLLVGGQFIAASFLLIAVIVMSQQNRELRREVLDSGGDPVAVITNMSALTKVKSEQLRDALERIPEVKSVSGDREQPWALSINTTGFARTADTRQSKTVQAYFERVDFDYFKTLGMKLLAGRVFSRDRGEDQPLDQPGAAQGSQPPATIVVDRDFASQLGFVNPEAAIGQFVYMPPPRDSNGAGRPVRIVGVVETQPSRFVGMGATATVYFHTTTLPFQLARISRDDVPGALKAIREAWANLAPDVPLNLTFVDSLFGETYTVFANISRAFLALSLFAFAISVIGLFGMATHIAARRVHEIGIRKTLGASTRQILTLLLTDFSKPVVMANLIAWPLAYLAVQLYLSIFVNRVAISPVPFALSFAITILIAWAAVGGQTLRAARVKPAQVLRYE